jgi:CDP-diacylglycerol--glycerol-3-phosphate 3-phosphatidyltransferase
MTGATVEHPGLRRHWTIAAGGLLLALGLVTATMALFLNYPVATRWALPTLAVVGYELLFLRRYLGTNHDEAADGSLYPGLGLANGVTVFRGGLFAAVAGFVAIEPRPGLLWVPALLYGTGCALDGLDGLIARLTHRTTVLGAKLDMAFDTLGFLVAPVVGVLWGRLPIWYLLLSLARYLFKAGRGLRRRRGKPVFELPASLVRRPLAGLQMAFITLALSPILPVETIWYLAVIVLTPSLVVFARDYLHVTGRLGEGAQQ